MNHDFHEEARAEAGTASVEHAYQQGYAAGQQHAARFGAASSPVDRLAKRSLEELSPIGGAAYGRPTFEQSNNRLTDPAPTPPVQSQLRITAQLLAGIEGAIDELEQRASFVLQPVPPQSVGTNPSPEGGYRGMSASACAVEEVNKQLDRQLTRLRDITRRLEV